MKYELWTGVSICVCTHWLACTRSLAEFHLALQLHILLYTLVPIKERSASRLKNPKIYIHLSISLTIYINRGQGTEELRTHDTMTPWHLVWCDDDNQLIIVFWVFIFIPSSANYTGACLRFPCYFSFFSSMRCARIRRPMEQDTPSFQEGAILISFHSVQLFFLFRKRYMFTLYAMGWIVRRGYWPHEWGNLFLFLMALLSLSPSLCLVFSWSLFFSSL